MKIKTILVILVISALLLFSGCAKKECSAKSDCISKGACFITSCVKGKCINTEKQGCTCGNLKCDSGENSCTCSADCGACTGNIGTLMQKSCVNNECVTSVKSAEQTSVEDAIQYIENRATKLELTLKASYDQPFNIKKSLFSVNIGVKKIYTGVTDVKITRIRLVQHSVAKDRYGKRTGDSPVILADREYSKTLFDENSEFVKEFPVFISSMDNNSEATKDVTLEITYGYTSTSQQTGTFEKDLEMVFVNPSQPVSCPSTCSDNNTCTTDSCGEQTGYFCEHKITSTGACCGDDACNLGEDRCRCPQDCGVCTGDIGTYMMMGCSLDKICSYAIKNPAIMQQTSKLADASFGKAMMSIKISYYTPFDKKNNKFIVVLEPKTLGGVIDLIISKVTVLDTAGTILGETSVSRTISEGTTGTVDIPLTYTTLSAEEEKTVRVRIDYSLKNPGTTAGVYTDIISYYQYDIGRLMILNPAS
jgi:hypothetical protein